MKKQWLFILSLLCIGSLLMGNTSSYLSGVYIPIFMERGQLEKSVSWKSEIRELIQPGKIYYKAPYIYVNERYHGVHVINNSNPKNPRQEGFIVAPGCIDIAVKDNILYMDNAVDLVAFDLTKKEVTRRIKNVFPEPQAPDNHYHYMGDRPENYVLVGWKLNK